MKADARRLRLGGAVIGLMVVACPVGGAWAQTIPEVVRPRSDTPTLPPGAGNDRSITPPRTENPLAGNEGVRPVPDNGVIAPPPAAMGSGMVIRPPASDDRSVVPAPGSPGGDRSVAPR